MNYTKGEWEYTRPQIGTPATIICTMVEPHFMPDCGDVTWYNGCVETMEANAHLIAAAPYMYEALQCALSTIIFAESFGNFEAEDTLRKIKDALSKAEGK